VARTGTERCETGSRQSAGRGCCRSAWPVIHSTGSFPAPGRCLHSSGAVLAQGR
jgi:hypothetical protein